METDHSLVLVDGMRISNSASAVSHSDFELGWVPMEAVERIEVVRGPMSSLYGSEALGGVVNIITRRATDKWRSSFSTFGVLTEHGIGGNGYNVSGYAGGPVVPGVLGLNMWGQFRGRTELASPSDALISSMNDQKAFIGNATLTWTPDERQRIDLSYSAGHEDRWRGAQSSGTYYRSEDDIWRQRFSLSHEGEWDWGASRIRPLQILSRPRERAQRWQDTVRSAQVRRYRR